MVKFYLIRHGQTAWNSSGRYQGQADIALSAEGRAQAQQLAEDFPEAHVDAIYASDLKRAYATAEALAARYNCPLVKEPAFREIDFGAWEGLTYQQMIDGWQEEGCKFFQAPEALIIPDGETFQEVQARAMKRLYQILHAEDGKTIAIVAHGAIIKAMLAALMHIPLHYVWSIRQANTAVNCLTYADDCIGVEFLNNTAHLSSPAASL